MSNPQLLQILNTAGFQNAEAYRLASGFTLVEGTQPVLENGVWMVAVSNDIAGRSETIALNSILQPAGPTFRTPAAFRTNALSSPEPLACGADESSEHDYSLDACFDPSTEAGREELLRQAASCDEEQRNQARDTIAYVLNGDDEALKQELEQALQELYVYDPEAAARAGQTYSQASSTPPQGSSAPSQGTNSGGMSPGAGAVPGPGGPSGNPAGNPLVAANGGTYPNLLGTAGLESDDVTAGFVPTAVSAETRFSPLGLGRPAVFSEGEEERGALPVILTSASVPAVLNPFSIDVPTSLPSSVLGALEAPPFAEARSEAEFFQALFGSYPVRNSDSGLTDLLAHPTREFAPKVYEVRRAVADALRLYHARYGTPAPSDRAPVAIGFRYDPARRRIEVSIDPSGIPHSSDHRGEREGVSRFSDLVGSFRSLSLFRLGSNDHVRGDEFGFAPIITYVPLPQQYLQGSRLDNGMMFARADRRATDRGVEPAVRRDSANDQHGGSQSEDREGRSRGGRGGRDRRDEELYADASEEDPNAAAA